MLLGPTLAPLIGGYVSREYSWRCMQIVLGAASLMAFLLTLACLPETIHPGATGYEKEQKQEKKLVFLNPLAPLELLLSPVVLATATASAIAMFTDVFLLIPLSHVFEKYFGIQDEFIIGAIFLPSGLGNIVGTLTAGSVSDYFIIKGKRSRGGVWLPEDRLKAALPGALFLTPISVLGYSLTTQFVPGHLGVFLNLFWLFLNGFGVETSLDPCAVYAADLFPARSAEVSAVSNGLRQVYQSGASGICLWLIKSMGIAKCGSIVALFSLSAGFLVVVTLLYGQQMREYKNMGYHDTSRPN